MNTRWSLAGSWTFAVVLLGACGGRAATNAAARGSTTIAAVPGGGSPGEAAGGIAREGTPATSGGSAANVAAGPGDSAGSSGGPAPSATSPDVGSSRENPVMRCGPRDSYYYVATEFRCSDGTNPLGGDVRMGSQARLGNVGPNSTGHIIDRYSVPCPEGARDVFVDMYGCSQPQHLPGMN